MRRRRSPSWLGPAVAGVACFLLATVLPRVGLWTDEQVEDVRIFQTFGDRALAGQIPYRDFFIEYPPGALVSFVPPALAPPEHYTGAFKALHVLFGCALVVIVALTLTRLGATGRRAYAAAAFTGLAPLALGPTVLNRYDLWPTLLAAAALATLVVGRRAAGFLLLGAATAAKGYALVLLPIALLYVWRREGADAARRAAVAYAAGLGALLLPFALLGPGGLKHSIWIQLRRGLHIESLPGSLVGAADLVGLHGARVFHGFAVEFEGTLASIAGAVAVAVEVAVLIGIYALFRLGRPTPERLVLASAAAVTAFVTLGKVLSPQFLIWLVPLVALAGGVAAGGMLLVSLALTRAFFPGRYAEVVHVEPALWLVVARNLVLVALLAFLVLRLRDRRGADVKPSS